MLHIKEAIIVEGKYDKQRLKRVTDAVILETNGFALYRDKALMRTIRDLAAAQGVIILTDSDGAGRRIRNYIKQCVGNSGVVKMAYIPSVEGKEKRKEKGGKEGLIGVEGIDEATLIDILKKTCRGGRPCPPADINAPTAAPITKNTFFEDGLTGKPDSRAKRERLCEALRLPRRLSCNALLDVLNKVYGYDVYKETIKQLGE